MTLAPGVAFSALDSADVVDDVLSVFLWLSDGSLVAVCPPLDELIRRSRVLVEATPAPALRVVPGLQ